MLYDYTPEHVEDLMVDEGARVQIYDRSDPDWFIVGWNGKFGVVPATYLQEEGHGEHSAENGNGHGEEQHYEETAQPDNEPEHELEPEASVRPK